MSDRVTLELVATAGALPLSTVDGTGFVAG